MWAIIVAWAVSAVGIVGLAVWVGRMVTGRKSGLLIDARGRYSLTHLQVALWTVVILSLVAGTAVGRVWHSTSPLGFDIPGELLAVMGISLGSGVLTTAAKASKDATRPQNVSAAMTEQLMERSGLTETERERWRPRFRQIYTQEEGAFADEVVDIGKFQNFVITLVLVLAYIVAVAQALDAAGSVTAFRALPGFHGVFLILLAVSHGAYAVTKMLPLTGSPATSLDTRNEKMETRQSP
jgi:hypothetical protein